MPHLMLEFSAERETQELLEKRVTTGREHITFRMIDTDDGNVIELTADARNVKQVERKPTWGEVKIAQETLNRKPGVGTIDEEAHRKIVRQLEDAQRDLASARADLVVKNDKIVAMADKIQQYESKDVKEGRDILASALDAYLEDLAASQDFSRYEQGKKIYRKLTGQKWVDDGSDDEEGDLST